MNKAKEICNKEGRGIPCVMIIGYILEKGQLAISKITDEQIDAIKENGLMTENFVKTLVRTAREVVRNCTQDDIVRLIKTEWCCSGEVYDAGIGYCVPEGRGGMSNARKTELVELMSSYLYDNELLDDFCDDRGVEFDDEEKEYLFPDMETEEEEEEEEW